MNQIAGLGGTLMEVSFVMCVMDDRWLIGRACATHVRSVANSALPSVFSVFEITAIFTFRGAYPLGTSRSTLSYYCERAHNT